MGKIFPVITVNLLFVIAPAVAQQAPNAALSDTLQVIDHKYDEVFVRRDPEGLAAFFTKDATIIPATGPAVSGTDIFPFWQRVLKIDITTHSLQITQSESLSPNLALATGHWTAGIRNASGATIEIGGDFCQVWRREGDAWKIRYVGWNQLSGR